MKDKLRDIIEESGMQIVTSKIGIRFVSVSVIVIHFKRAWVLHETDIKPLYKNVRTSVFRKSNPRFVKALSVAIQGEIRLRNTISSIVVVIRVKREYLSFNY